MRTKIRTDSQRTCGNHLQLKTTCYDNGIVTYGRATADSEGLSLLIQITNTHSIWGARLGGAGSIFIFAAACMVAGVDKLVQLWNALLLTLAQTAIIQGNDKL